MTENDRHIAPPLAETAARDVLRRILDGHHPPGARLTEREIIAIAGGTHAGARETLHYLEKLGAVRIQRHRGAVILDPREAPPEEMQAVWVRLLALLERLAGQTLERQAADQVPGFTAYQSLCLSLERLAVRAGDPRLGALLQRIALHRAIVTTKAVR